MFRINQFGRSGGAVVLGLVMGVCARLMADPQGAQVVSGSASISQSGNLTQITAGNNAVINYQSFNIASNETVQFIQPGATSRVLNRVLGPDPSAINGSLLANGIVYIVNPAGVYFGNGAVVNVGGIYAGAGNLSTNDFLSGLDHFTDVSGNVVNYGSISAELVTLVGRHVANYGTILSPNGTVTMLAGDDVLVGDREHHFMVRLTGMGAEAAAADDKPGVENSGSIDAGKGKVIWGAGDMYAMALRNVGTVKAGEVTAEAAAGVSEIKGTIDASSATGPGGSVTITGGDIAVYGTIDARGATGGGTVKIGGDRQGGGTLAHAHALWIGADANVLVDALNAGNGGTIILYSDAATRVYGTLSATGAGSGHGGFVETSGGWLEVAGAPIVGAGGQWLIDPRNITISSGATTGASGGPAFVANADDAVINIDDILDFLAGGGDVTISTGGGGGQAGDVTFADPIDINGIGGGRSLSVNAAGNITVSAAIFDSFDGADSLQLTFTTAGDVIINAGIDVGHSTVVVGPLVSEVGGSVTFDAAGAVDVNAAIVTNGGSFAVLNASGTTFDNTGGSIVTDGGAVSIVRAGNITLGENGIDTTTATLRTGVVSVQSTGGSIATGVADDPAPNIVGQSSVDLRATQVGSPAVPVDIFDATQLTIIGSATGFAVRGNGQTLATFDAVGTVGAFAATGFGNLNNYAGTYAGGNLTIDDFDFTDVGATNFVITQPTGNIIFSDGAGSLGAMDSASDRVTFSATTGSITLGKNIFASDPANLGTLRLVAGGGSILTVALDPGDKNLLTFGPVELVASNSIGSAGDHVTLANTKVITLDVNDDLFVDHDGVTDITSLTLLLDPAGAATYVLQNFNLETFNLVAFNDDLMINTMVTTSAGTSYSVTAKTGNIFVDDNGSVIASPITGNVGDGGIQSNNGNVTLIASAGGVLEELARDDYNVRTDNLSPRGPVVTVRAVGAAGKPGTIGGDPDAGVYFDIQGSRRIVLDARGHLGVRGSDQIADQPIELLMVTLDPAGPNLGGTPHYDVINFDTGDGTPFDFDMASVGGTLVINSLKSNHIFDVASTADTADDEGAAFFVRSRTGDILVNPDAIQTFLVSRDPLMLALPGGSNPGGGRSVYLISDRGDIRLTDGSVQVNNIGLSNLATPTVAMGAVHLYARGKVREEAGFVNQTIKARTDDYMEIFADNVNDTVAGNADAIGQRLSDDPAGALDTQDGILFARAGQDLMNAFLNSLEGGSGPGSAGNHAGGIYFTDRLGTLIVRRAQTFSGDIDLRTLTPTVGQGHLRLEDNAIEAGSGGVGPGNGNVVLVANGDIRDESLSGTVKITALGDRVTLISGLLGGTGDIGADPLVGPDDTRFIEINALELAASAGGAGGVFVRDISGSLRIVPSSTVLNPTGPDTEVLGVSTANGNINVETVSEMFINGPVVTTTPSDIVLTVSAVDGVMHFQPSFGGSSGSIGDDGFPTHNQTYTAAGMVLEQDMTFRATDGSDVVFQGPGVSVNALDSDSVNSRRNLTVVSDGGGAVFFHSVIGAGAPIRTLQTFSATTHLYGDVTTGGPTAGTQIYNSAVVVHDNITLLDLSTAPDSGIYFNSTLDTDGTPWNLTILVNPDADNPERPPLISFAGNVGTNEFGNLLLNAIDADGDGVYDGDPDSPGDTLFLRNYVPTVATIIAAARDADGNILPDATPQIIFAVAENFTVGYNEKITALGDFGIAAGDTIRIGDLNVRGDMILFAIGGLIVQLHDANPGNGILRPTGFSFVPDLGTDIWVRGTPIFFTPSITFEGAGPAPRLYVGALDPVISFSVVPNPFITTFVNPANFPQTHRIFDDARILLDLFLLNDVDLATAFGFQPPRLEDRIYLLRGRNEDLQEMHIAVRDASVEDYMNRLAGNALYNDIVLEPGAGLAPVTVNRIREQVIRETLARYRALFTPEAAGELATKLPVSHAGDVKAAIGGAGQHYRAASGGAALTGSGFRHYLEDHPDEADALGLLNSLGDLFRMMDQLGLTEAELRAAKLAIAQQVTPEGMTPDALIEAAESGPKSVSMRD